MLKLLSYFAAMSLVCVTALAGGRQTATLDVSNMDCAACPITVRMALEKVPGVASAKVDFHAKTAVVSYDPAQTTPKALTQATSDAGFPSKLRGGQ
ncbi:MAG: mercury resistance system periplasmic binding protein MerP [Proteobacteria bacterium]|nr:mercury resistance system periplasmic binding protein MerP [Pseudomonadota bacterium]